VIWPKGVRGSGTAYVEFDGVIVPKSNLIGDVSVLLGNFVTERIGIAVQANRFARVCLQESIEHCRKRKAFKTYLVDMPVVRYKLATMAREISVTHAYTESLCYRLVTLEAGGGDWMEALLKMGAEVLKDPAVDPLSNPLLVTLR